MPLIGTCFSTRTNQDDRTNVIIFMRPHIIRNKADMVRLTDCEKRRYDEKSAPCSYMMTGEKLMDILNIRSDCCPACKLPYSSNCGAPCCPCRLEAGCDHSCDPYFDDFFRYPLER